MEGDTPCCNLETAGVIRTSMPVTSMSNPGGGAETGFSKMLRNWYNMLILKEYTNFIKPFINVSGLGYEKQKSQSRKMNPVLLFLLVYVQEWV